MRDQLSPRQKILNLMLEQPQKWWFALEICRATGLASGTVGQQLFILDQRGYTETRWEGAEEARLAVRPPRRFHRLTHDGQNRTRQELEEKERSLPGTLKPQLAPG